jgi:hypothetical protein
LLIFSSADVACVHLVNLKASSGCLRHSSVCIFPTDSWPHLRPGHPLVHILVLALGLHDSFPD